MNKKILFAFFVVIICIFLNDSYQDVNKNSTSEYIDDAITVSNIPTIDNKIILKIDGTKINEEISKGDDNEFYLNHDKDGNYDIKGSDFMDYRINEKSKKIIIYGHSSLEYDVPFNELENYYDYNYYKTHKYITLNYNGEKRYEIFSVYVETEDWSYTRLTYLAPEEYLNDLNKYKNKSIYETGVVPKINDDVLILQTCSTKEEYSNYKNKYLLIIARRIKWKK